ncbi:MAG: N-6 DNA methylase [Proteiniphilum sp.]|uniref:HsdM family class I SAM-dependent methyltransferase n=1 Tax=Proteiniphilum sp. TaxID=1926877 RepID=UPI002AB82CA6|nr:N-6 DNA methylase [Proteiniphilum sp.]MDY9917324.1 N-6 DNA methylase [Proteiniphilum sp.]
MDAKGYINNIRKLDFQIENQHNSSVFIVDNLETYIKQEEISPYIIIALDKAKSFEADAVYFRLFDDNRPPLAQIYLYDNILNPKSESHYAEIHRAIWSGCEIPMYMVVDKTQIKVFDSRRPVDIKHDKPHIRPIDLIDLTTQNDILKKYRAQMFNNGLFWETKATDGHFLNKTAAAERLIKSLRFVRRKFNQEIGHPEFSDSLLIMCILIKYLEENGVEDTEANLNLAHEFFYKNTGYKTLTEILYNNKLVELLSALSDHFNGGIFNFKSKDENENWIEKLKSLDLKDLSVFFDAGSTENLFGWRDYSFEHIPVELISNLYEEFLPKEKKAKGDVSNTPQNGAVYTPSFLVNLLIDECLPLHFNNLNENVKLIDPACGSGIFLVSAFKRLTQRWRMKNRYNGKLADTTPEVLKNILSKNIFGVDIHYNSVHLTVFSLQLALCSMLTPRQVWTGLGQFLDLEAEGNVIEKDFFNYLAENKFQNDFDLVVGNPPFKELHRDDFLEYKNSLTEMAGKEGINLDIPSYQEALLFLSTSFMLLKKQTGKLCLILKSGPFLYSGDENKKQNANLLFRSNLLKQHSVTQIIDFTLLKKLFKANVETAAVFIDNKSSIEDNTITHIVIRDSKTISEKSFFEISHYDFHEVPLSIAISDPHVWKCNLLGGAQVYHLVSKLKTQKKLKEFLSDKKREGWDYGQGYKVGNRKKEDVEKIISGKNSIIDKEFKDDGIKGVSLQEETHFESIPKNSAAIFSPPHLMIKKTIGKKNIPIDLRDDYLTFRNEILGIHCPVEKKEELLRLAQQLKKDNDILRFFITATSARSGIMWSMYSSDLSDLLNLPLLAESTFEMNKTEQIIVDDVKQYYIEELSKGRNSAIHKKNVDEGHIKSFAMVYCDLMNTIYAKGGYKYYFSKFIDGDSFSACEFTFGSGGSYSYERSHANLDELLFEWNSSQSVKFKRIIRMYGHNIIRIIKPKKLMYWLRSIALRDFDDTISDIFRNSND